MESIRAITSSIVCFEMLLFFAEKLSEAGQLTREKMKEVEEITQDIYGLLESATYESRKDLRKPEHQNHPLKLLWDRWHACSEKVSQLAGEFLQTS